MLKVSAAKVSEVRRMSAGAVTGELTLRGPALPQARRGLHCQGSVRIGRRTFPMREFSIGCTSKADAEAIGGAEEARIRGEFLDTGGVIEPARVITIQDCIAAYKSRPGNLHQFDIQRLNEFDTTIGNHPPAPGRGRRGVHGSVPVDVASHRLLLPAGAPHCSLH